MKRILYLLTILLMALGNLTISAQDFATGLVRLKSKRTAWYLSTEKSGAATTTAKSTTKLSQVWILETYGEGYYLRSANTGEYLQADYTTPATGKTHLYIRVSPNATATAKCYNISSDCNFAGSTFLNTNTSHALFNYSMDAGCDWYIEAETNYTDEEVLEHLHATNPFTNELKDGTYYRLHSIYSRVLTESTNLATKELDTLNYGQCWQLQQNGEGWSLQTAITQKYILRQTQASKPYRLGTAKVAFNIKPTGDKWDTVWTISYGNDWGGMHDASSQGHDVVYWDTTAEASTWHLEEVAIDEELLQQIRHQQADYDSLVANKSQLQQHLNNLFEDLACTTLKADITALSNEQLATNEDFSALNADMQTMVLKVKNDSWQQFTDKTTGYTADYERLFRMTAYQPYSNHETMANAKNFTMSNAFGRLSGPTGIVANANDIIYIYVDAAPKTGATLMVEAVSTDGVAGNHPTGETLALKAGLNLLRYPEQKMLYVFYQVTDPAKKLSLYPDIFIHIEGGQLQGYWDATRNMTNADWKLLQQDLLKACPILNLKTQHLVFCMDANLVKQAEPDEMEGLMRIWDRIADNEERYMGVEDFEGRFRNIWNVFSGASSYMHSTTYGTWYHESTIPTVMNYKKMTQPGSIWGPSHEIGHNHQASINVIGTTESSNNLFSNINTFEQGITTSRRQLPVDVFYELSKGTRWLERNIWNTTSMFFQLYLYFHVQHHNDQFLPDLFRAMRKSPINKSTGKGSTDYLKLAKTICDVAQADLSEFFEAYGMFVPGNKIHVSDYAEYDVTTTQADINAARNHMQQYNRKLGNIMFIDDHLEPMKPADVNNIFEGVPATSNGLKKNNLDQHNEVAEYKSLPIGESGDYELFTDDAPDVTDDYYSLSANGRNITFHGTNYAGHKFYDQEGNLVWATNARTVTLPKNVLTLGIDNVSIVTAMYNMKDAPCTNQKPDPAGINAITTDRGQHQILNLQGQRLQQANAPGIYIINGKKIYIKS
ncbi:MAG: M60 family metallopeptidase [Prevotella sp.]|nr:M60 family metallopeptidase [Prevotella sp.]